ncbi:MAG: replication-associated recombination protein A, partial [Actinobacteria bacterium]|nr:replication-associated recombination protein A [Actinomycetota bacterium]
MSDQLFDTGDGAAGGAAEEIPPNAPLAVRMRPRTLDEMVGQEHIVGEGSALRA